MGCLSNCNGRKKGKQRSHGQNGNISGMVVAYFLRMSEIQALSPIMTPSLTIILTFVVRDVWNF